MKKNDAVFLSKASYHTFGWLKRPEYDSDAGYAYEMPNGDCYLQMTHDTNMD